MFPSVGTSWHVLKSQLMCSFQLRELSICTPRYFVFWIISSGIYQAHAAGYWRDLSGSGIYQAHAAFNSQKNQKLALVSLPGSLFFHSMSLSYQILFVSFHLVRRSISGFGRKLHASIFSTVRPIFELLRSCEELSWNQRVEVN